MKVLHVITGLRDGGAEGVLSRICASDQRNVHTVVSLSEPGKYGPRLRAVGIEVHSLSITGWFNGPVGLFKLYSLIKLTNPDVVQTWMYHGDLIGGFAAKIAGIKRVFWNVRHTNFHAESSKPSTLRIVAYCRMLSAWIPYKIVYCGFGAKFVHEALGYEKQKSTVILNGCDITRFKSSEKMRKSFRVKCGLSSSELVVGMVGRYDPQKDHEGLFSALKALKSMNFDFKVLLAGHGIDINNKNLKFKISDYGLEEDIKLLGSVSDIPALMNALDVHVLSSSFGEGFPNVLIEAMACGTPCVATDVGDAKDIIGETGWVAPPSDPIALAASIRIAMEECQSNFDTWHRRKDDCRSRVVQNFSMEMMIGEYQKLWSGREDLLCRK